MTRGGDDDDRRGGNYIFDGLPAGVYVVEVDAAGGLHADRRPGRRRWTTRRRTPIVLAPGDVYVNADFGYQPTAGLRHDRRHGLAGCRTATAMRRRGRAGHRRA